MKKGIKAVLCLLISFVVFRAAPVLAAGGGEISMKAEKDSHNDRQLVVSCRLEEGDQITNGKLRIYYDKDKVSLLSSSTADALSDALCEINDCITGNKPEGEVVAAFAASKSIPSGRKMLEFKFRLNDEVSAGDKIHFEVQVEKLAGDNKEVQAENSELTYTAGGGDSQNSSGSGDDGKTGGKKDDKKDSGDTKDSGKVNTGDDTPILVYVFLGGAALLVILICIIIAIRQKRGRE